MGKAPGPKLRRGKRDAARGFIPPQRQIRLRMANPQHGKPRQARPKRGQPPAQQARGQPARRCGVEFGQAMDFLCHKGRYRHFRGRLAWPPDKAPPMALTATPIPCLSDNYAWLLRAADGRLAVCDPAEDAPVAAVVEAMGGKLDLILLTHHHGDHVAGVPGLVARYGAKVVGAAADQHRLPPLDQAVAPGDSVDVLGSKAAVLASDGHTRGHIAFHIADSHILLCGDTLFSLGCGRLLEGTPAQMFASLAALAALPGETLVCCGHEYTESNARFAITVEPDNAALKARIAEVHAQRAAGKPTLPSTIASERAANPFMRAPDIATLARIRAGKDTFR